MENRIIEEMACELTEENAAELIKKVVEGMQECETFVFTGLRGDEFIFAAIGDDTECLNHIHELLIYLSKGDAEKLASMLFSLLSMFYQIGLINDEFLAEFPLKLMKGEDFS